MTSPYKDTAATADLVDQADHAMNIGTARLLDLAAGCRPHRAAAFGELAVELIRLKARVAAVAADHMLDLDIL